MNGNLILSLYRRHRLYGKVNLIEILNSTVMNLKIPIINTIGLTTHGVTLKLITLLTNLTINLKNIRRPAAGPDIHYTSQLEKILNKKVIKI
jgi:hypothetical protein